VEYDITLYEDGSALWVIRQVLDINATCDDLYDFQKRISTLINETQNLTNRKMAIGLELSVRCIPLKLIKRLNTNFYG